jgi:VWFA-related protein
MKAINGSIFTSFIGAHRLVLLLVLLLPLMACGGGGSGGGGTTAVASETGSTPGDESGSTPDDETGSTPEEMSLSINQLAQNSCPQLKAYVAVTDAQGQPIEALTPEDFSIYANGELVEGVNIQWAPEVFAPISVSFVMDYSGSMTVEAVGQMEGAADAFVDQMASEDWGEVIKFALLGEVVQAYTPNKAALKTAIAEPWAFSGSQTMLYDAVYRSVADTAQREGRRAVLAISDGIDNASQHNLDELITFAGEENVPVFTVGLNQADTESLAQLAAGTGGRYFYAPDPTALADIYAQLASLLKNQYVISYGNGSISDLEHTLEVIAESDGQVAGDTLWVTGCPAPPTLELAGSLAIGGNVKRLDRQADHLYLASGNAGMAIVDVSDPALPILDGVLSTLADASGFTALDVAAEAPYAFIAAGDKGLIVADVSTADDPQIVATVSPSFNDPDSDVKLTAFTAVAAYPPFVFALDQNDGFVVFLFQDPQHIFYQVETGIKGNQLWVSGKHLYITTAAGLSIYDISTPAQPELVGQAVLEDGGDAITLAYPYAYVALAAGKGVAVVDVSLPSAPTLLGTLITDAAIHGLGVQNGFAFAGSGEGDLNIVDVRQPQTPETLGQITVGGSLEAVEMSNEWAYVAAGDAGLQVLRIAR